MRSRRMIVIDGPDSSGKSTQLQILSEKLQAKGCRVLKTRLLGGDGNDWLQLELRELLLHQDFPSDSVISEERLFAAAGLRSLEMSFRFLEENQNGIVLQDRGLPSHLCYSLAKGLNISQARRIHDQVISAYLQISHRFGGMEVLLLPSDEKLIMQRIVSRGHPAPPRLENIRLQREVLILMRSYAARQLEISPAMPSVVVNVTPGKTIEQVGQEIDHHVQL